jgi:hypothetical protein
MQYGLYYLPKTHKTLSCTNRTMFIYCCSNYKQIQTSRIEFNASIFNLMNYCNQQKTSKKTQQTKPPVPKRSRRVLYCYHYASGEHCTLIIAETISQVTNSFSSISVEYSTYVRYNMIIQLDSKT